MPRRRAAGTRCPASPSRDGNGRAVAMAADHGDHVTPDQFKGRARRARNSPDVAVRRRHARADRRDPRRRHRRRHRTTTPPHRMGGGRAAQDGRARERTESPRTETTREEPTNETTTRGGQGRHRRPKDGRQRSGADAGAQPPRPPAPATPQTPTVDRDATDARQAVHRQGSPRSGPGSTRPALEARLYRAMLLQAGAIVGAVVAILRMLD